MAMTTRGVSAMERMTTAVMPAAVRASMTPAAQRASIKHEGELPALGEEAGAVEGFAVAGLEQARDGVDADALDQHEGGDAGGDELPVGRDQLKSSDMPTPRKNRPSRMPRNGSTSASSWWRNVDSDSSTPARKAPMPMERPPHCMKSAAPRTTRSAAAVITSRAPERARMPNSGFISHRPATNTSATAPMPMPTVCHSGRVAASAWPPK